MPSLYRSLTRRFSSSAIPTPQSFYPQHAGPTATPAEPYERDYPMWVLPIADCMTLEKLEPHQTMIKQDRLCRWDGVGNVLFVSHQWVGDFHPDPRLEQFKVLQGALKILAEGNTYVDSDMKLQILGGAITISGPEWAALLNAADTYVWYDFMSCPQPTAAEATGDVTTGPQLQAAIESIPSYVSRSKYQIVLCPPLPHANRPSTICDLSSWMGRGWCRLEAVCHLLQVGGDEGSAMAHAGRPQILIEGVTQEAIRFRPAFDTITAMWSTVRQGGSRRRGALCVVMCVRCSLRRHAHSSTASPTS